MTIGVLISLISGIFGGLVGLGAILTAIFNRGRGKAQSETEARAQNTAEFNAIVGALKGQLDQATKDISDLKAEVYDIRAEHRSAEDYIDLLMTGIYNGTIPPIPPRSKTP